jgi:hypothetical protein
VASLTLSAALREASATRSVARSTLAPNVSVDAVVVEVVDVLDGVDVAATAVSDGSAVFEAVLVRVDLLQPVNASPATRVVNKIVFFIGRYELPGD